MASSAKWNGVAVADGVIAAATPSAGAITYDYNLTSPGNFAVTARIGSVAPGNSGNFSFVVNVPSTATPGVINNTGRFCYNDGAILNPLLSTAANCSTGGNKTNVVPYTVLPTYSVIASDYYQSPNLKGSAATTPSASSTTDTGGVKDNIVTVAAATQGGVVSFDNVIVNSGNATDSFNISTSASNFPSGTTFLLLRSDGVTPMSDSNGDGIVDTGPLAPGAVTHVFVKAVLPAVSLGGPFSVTVTATSVGAGVSDTVTDTLTVITANKVDLTNNSAGVVAGNGNGIYTTPTLAIAAGAIVTNATNPGTSTTFTLVVNNTSSVADNYGLSVDQTIATLPAGWTVNFYATATPYDCTTLGASLTNTGVVLASGNATVCAVVSVPASQAAIPTPGQKIVFKVASPATGATDYLLDAVTVNTVRSISLTPNHSAQIYAGGTVVYKHTLTNTGNVTETTSVSGGVTVSSSSAGATLNWGNVLYADSNGDGVLDAGDALLTSVTLSPGQSLTILNKVLAPGSAAAGDVNTVLLTATQTDTGTINGVAVPTPVSAQDVSTVIAGQVNLVKLQSQDLACTGTVSSWTNATLTAKPGQCLLYQITATNVGVTAALSLVISDSTPINTTYNCNAASTGAAGGSAAVALSGGGGATPTAPATCASGTISSGTISSLAPGASAVLSFGVQINP